MKKSIIITIAIALVLVTAVSLVACNAGFNPDKAITVVAREQSSGTREAFDKVVTDGTHYLNEKDENGKENKVKKTISVADGNLGGSPYTFIFDSEHTMAYTGDNTYDMMELRMEQELANNLLKARGYIYLNEILDRLGLKTSKMGQVVGWVYNPDDNNADGFVDFGVREISIPSKDGELESKIVLDFNVQGNILDLMP